MITQSLRVALLCLPLACCASVPDLPQGSVIGQELSPARVLPFATVDQHPQDHYHQQVLVAGTITAVCQNAGCWMQIEDQGKVATVRWETGCGGEYAFPKDSVGKHVVVQGTLYPKVADVEHLAAEAGDEARVQESIYEFNASAILLVDDESKRDG